MIGGELRAPQYGQASTLPPVSDNPADARRPVPMPAAIRARLGELRAQFAAVARGVEFPPRRRLA